MDRRSRGQSLPNRSVNHGTRQQYSNRNPNVFAYPSPHINPAFLSQHQHSLFQQANPYFQQSYNAYSQQYYSSNYLSAYAQPQSHHGPRAATTPDGYTLSSTYIAGPSTSGYPNAGPLPQPDAPEPPGSSRANDAAKPQRPALNRNGPGGPQKCTHPGCQYSSGSRKDVEIHMMDRHLIYPSGWDPQKNKGPPDSDAPANMPILGTNIKLETPEQIAAWIADRKKRWPTAQRIKEKEQKRKEAIERGEIDAVTPRKKRRLGGELDVQHGGRGRGRGKGRGDVRRGRGQGITRAGRGGGPTGQSSKIESDSSLSESSSDEDSSSDPEESSSNSDMDPVLDAISSKQPSLSLRLDHGSNSDKEESPREDIDHPGEAEEDDDLKNEQVLKPVRKPAALQPKKAINNPFGNRPSLLRNLLLPEIRSTVSNLSQAIRFLVANDFLEGVEMKAGQTESAMIQVIGETTSNDPLSVSNSKEHAGAD